MTRNAYYMALGGALAAALLKVAGNVHVFSFLLGALAVVSLLVACAVAFLVHLATAPRSFPQSPPAVVPARVPRASGRPAGNGRLRPTPHYATRATQCADGPQARSFSKLLAACEVPAGDGADEGAAIVETGRVLRSAWLRISAQPLSDDKVRAVPPGPLPFSLTHSSSSIPGYLAALVQDQGGHVSDAKALLAATRAASVAFPASRTTSASAREGLNAATRTAGTQYSVPLAGAEGQLEPASPAAPSQAPSTPPLSTAQRLANLFYRRDVRKQLLGTLSGSSRGDSSPRTIQKGRLRTRSTDETRGEPSKSPGGVATSRSASAVDSSAFPADLACHLVNRLLGLDQRPLLAAGPLADDPAGSDVLAMYFPTLTGVSVERALSSRDCNVFAVLRSSGWLTLYVDETCAVPIESLSVFDYALRLWPHDSLLNNEVFLKVYPLQLQAPDGSLADRYLYFSRPAIKEEWFLEMKSLLKRHPGGARSAAAAPPRRRHTPFFLDVVDRLRYAVYFPRGFYDFLGAAHFLPAATAAREPAADAAWLNALVARGFVALARSVAFRETLMRKFTRKLTRIERPSFVGDIVIRDVSLGGQAPVLANPQLVSMDAHGQVLVNCTMAYAGGFRIAVSTTITIPSPTRYVAPVRVPVELSFRVLKMCGDLLVRFAPEELSNRAWVGFYPSPAPVFEADLEPVVGNVGLTWSWIKAQMMAKVREQFDEQLVLPNMDDLDFGDVHAGGGIFDNLDGTLEELGQRAPGDPLRSGYDALLEEEALELKMERQGNSLEPGSPQSDSGDSNASVSGSSSEAPERRGPPEGLSICTSRATSDTAFDTAGPVADERLSRRGSDVTIASADAAPPSPPIPGSPPSWTLASRPSASLGDSERSAASGEPGDAIGLTDDDESPPRSRVATFQSPLSLPLRSSGAYTPTVFQSFAPRKAAPAQGALSNLDATSGHLFRSLSDEM